MTSASESTSDESSSGESTPPPQVIGPDGHQIVAAARESGTSLGDLVEQPAKVMRIGSMVRQLLDEVKAAPLDAAGRTRLRDIHVQSIKELQDGLAPELVEELERLSLPFEDDIARRSPSCAWPRPSWSGGWKGCSTASRRPCTPSRCRPSTSSRT